MQLYQKININFAHYVHLKDGYSIRFIFGKRERKGKKEKEREGGIERGRERERERKREGERGGGGTCFVFSSS